MSVASDERFTPGWLLDLVRKFAGGSIAFDAATTEENPVGALEYYTPTGHYYDGAQVMGSEGNGRRQPWSGCGVNWCNPPYSRGELPRWANKAIGEARDGCELIMLTPGDMRTRWFRDLRENADCIGLMSCRVLFGTPADSDKGGSDVEVSRGMALWYFGRQRARFRRVFGPVAWVVDGPGVQDAEGAVDAAE